MSKFSDRVRFNWGFHDGTLEATNGTTRDVSDHHDRFYADGYKEGVVCMRLRGNDPDNRPETSEPWWDGMTCYYQSNQIEFSV